MLAIAAWAALPGSAQARTDQDPCDSRVGTLEDGLTCAEKYPVLNQDTVWLPVSSMSCAPDTYIIGTDYWSEAFDYNWDWDYFVEGGDYVLWDGGIRVQPDSGSPPAYNGLQIRVENWRKKHSISGEDFIDATLFMRCAPLDTRSKGAAAPPLSQAGDASDETLPGDEDKNALVGRGGDDRLIGRAGQDYLHAGSGHDVLRAGRHDDLLHARSGRDTAIGGADDDAILTGRGDDVSLGGDGNDELFDDEGTDTLRGGPGDDHFSAVDGDRDVIRCGAGSDEAMVDRFDAVTGCERVF